MPSKQVVDIYVSRIVSLLQPISEKLYVITGKDQIQNSCNENTEFLDTGMVMRFRNEKHLKASAIYQAFTILFIQLKICYLVIKISNKMDTVIFGMGGSINFFLSTLTAKVLRKKVVVSALGRGSLSHRIRTKGTANSFYSSILTITENINYRLADKIIVESNIAVKSPPSGKICFATRQLSPNIRRHRQIQNKKSNWRKRKYRGLHWTY